jgi:pimeloyl-ACP methyl ester carboxylesterase
MVPGGTAEHWRWFTEKMRLATSPRIAQRMLRLWQEIDVCDLARQVRCPALILHARHDAIVPYEEGKLMASLIPGAEFVTLDSANHLILERAHIIGHSSGGNIALQLALDAPTRVHTLSLLEPALPVGTTADRLLATRQAAMGPIMDSWRKGDKAGAVDGFMRMVSGPAYRTAFERALPGAFERGVADAETFFGQELPALQQWQLTPDDAGRITQPVLAVMGGKSPEVSPIWIARQQLLQNSLPNDGGRPRRLLCPAPHGERALRLINRR